jgi:hypothetical protein
MAQKLQQACEKRLEDERASNATKFNLWRFDRCAIMPAEFTPSGG